MKLSSLLRGARTVVGAVADTGDDLVTVFGISSRPIRRVLSVAKILNAAADAAEEEAQRQKDGAPP